MVAKEIHVPSNQFLYIFEPKIYYVDAKFEDLT